MFGSLYVVLTPQVCNHYTWRTKVDKVDSIRIHDIQPLLFIATYEGILPH